MRAMYMVAIVGLSLFFAGFYLARDAPDMGKSRMIRGFYRLAYCMYHFFIQGVIVKYGLYDRRHRDQISVCLERLHPGESLEALTERYYVNKIALSLMMSFAGLIIGCALSFQAAANLRVSDGEVIRGDYTQLPEEMILEGDFPEGRQQIEVQVHSRTMSIEETEVVFASFCTKLPNLIKGENESLDQVYTSLRLESTFESFPLWVAWESENPEIVSTNGVVSLVDENREVNLIMTAHYGEWEQSYRLTICVVPPIISEQERLRRSYEDFLLSSEEQSREDRVWKLPDSYGTFPVHWRQIVADHGPAAWIVSLALAVLLFLMADRDLFERLQTRKQSFRRDYPEVLHQFVLYMGAGMTIRGSLRKIADNHRKRMRGKRLEQPVYDELLFACRELQTGVSEAIVYERLGKRLGVQEFIRFTTLLSQSVKKGNSNLLQRLQEEAQKANELHLQYARKRGEVMGTKLLLPMVLLLLTVMIILIFPAFWSVGI